MKKIAWPLGYRLLFVIAHLIVLQALKKDLFEVKGFDSYSIEQISEWGGMFLKYATTAAIIAALVLPIRFAFCCSGLVLGGLAMIGLIEGRNIKDLAEMDETLNLKELIVVQSGGHHLAWGLGFCVVVILIGTFAKIISGIIQLLKHTKKESPAGEPAELENLEG